VRRQMEAPSDYLSKSLQVGRFLPVVDLHSAVSRLYFRIRPQTPRLRSSARVGCGIAFRRIPVEAKGRLKLFEIYLLGVECRRAISLVGVARGTFHYWLQDVNTRVRDCIRRLSIFSQRTRI